MEPVTSILKSFIQNKNQLNAMNVICSELCFMNVCREGGGDRKRYCKDSFISNSPSPSFL